MENALKMPMEESNEESEEVSEGNTSAKSDDESDNTDDKHEWTPLAGNVVSEF